MAKRKVTLYSLNPSEYPNIEVEFDVVENIAQSIDAVANPNVVKAKKVAVVKARRAQAGEVVDTRPRAIVDGKVYVFTETTQKITPEKAEKGAIIVTNPDGEEYVIASAEKFAAKYEKCDGGYKAIDGAKKFRQAERNCIISTSWGEEQIIPKGSMFCVEYENDIYGVTNAAFEATYTTDPKIVTPPTESTY